MWGALVLLWCGGRVGYVDNWSPTAYPDSPGSESRANGHEGFTGTWETLPVATFMPAGFRLTKLRADPQLPSRAAGTNRGHHVGIAKRRKRSTARRAAGSRSAS